jgi:hypothetical protein
MALTMAMQLGKTRASKDFLELVRAIGRVPPGGDLAPLLFLVAQPHPFRDCTAMMLCGVSL